MHVVAAAGVVARDELGRIVLVRRAVDGSWALPGGHLEPGETWLECAQREFQEETGWRVAVEEVLGLYSDPGTQVAESVVWNEAVQFVGVVFEGRIMPSPDAEELESPEISAIELFDLAALPGNLYPPDVPVLDDARSTRRRPFVR